MKKLSKMIFALVGISILFLTSCMENEIVREPSPAENSYGVYFLNENSIDVTVPSEATSYTYTLARSKTSGAITVPITSASGAVFTCPTTVAFADGEETAEITVTFNDLPSTPQTVDLTIDPTYAALYAPGHNQFVGTIKAINWIVLGTGQFYDSFVMASVNNVQVKRAEGTNTYRIMNPYPNSILVEADWDNWIGGINPEYIEFWINSDNTCSWDTFWYTGLIYQGGAGDYVKAYLPSALAASQAPNDAKSKVLQAGKLFTLCPYYYVTGLGGWGVKSTYLSLPGGPDLYEYLGL